MKFGGTSLGDAERVGNAIEIVAASRSRRPVVIVSALPGITNDLVAASDAARASDIDEVNATVAKVRMRHEDVAMELVKTKFDFFESFIKQLDRQIEQIHVILKGVAILGEVTRRANDKITAIGAKLSSVLFAYSMMMKALPGEHVDAEEVLITDEAFGDAIPLMDETRTAAREVLLPLLERGLIPVLGGYVGRSTSGATTTLGHGGADYSAAIIGAAIEAEEIQIWTDVDGLLTCDPRLVPGARVIESISFAEAAQLTQFGSRLPARTLQPAMEAAIPVHVLNSYNPKSLGTVITSDAGEQWSGARSVACRRGATIFSITSTKDDDHLESIANLFRILADMRISADLIVREEASVTVACVEAAPVDELSRRLRALGNSIASLRGQSVVAVVGQHLSADTALSARVLDALHGIPVHMVSLGPAGLNFSVVVDDAYAAIAVRRIHHVLFEINPQVLRIDDQPGTKR